MFSKSASTPSPETPETGQQMMSPPQSSGVRPRFCSCCLTRSTLAVGLSHLVIATMIWTPAWRQTLMHSSVWGMMPSSAAMMRTAMSVIWAPRARIALKAAWPGVSRKVILRPATSTW